MPTDVRRTFLASALLLHSAFLSGCQRDENDQDRPKDNWAEFCKTRDCSKYPAGYRTIDVAGSPVFYIPLNTKEGNLNPSGTIFLQQDGVSDKQTVMITSGRVQAYAGITGRLLVHFGLTDWPRDIAVPSNMTLKFHEDSRWQKKTWNSGPGGQVGTAPFNDDFDIVYQDQEIKRRLHDEELPYRRFALISKQPILLGRRAVFQCEESCQIISVPTLDEANRNVEVKFEQIFSNGRLLPPFEYHEAPYAPAIVAQECPGASPLIDCDHLDKKLANLSKAIRLLDAMLTGLQRYPTVSAP